MFQMHSFQNKLVLVFRKMHVIIETAGMISHHVLQR